MLFSSLSLTPVTPFSCDSFHLQFVNLDYGMKDENPIDNVRFYRKDSDKKAFPLHKDMVSCLLPNVFSEHRIRVFCRKTDQASVKAAKSNFKDWCKKAGYKYSSSQVTCDEDNCTQID